MSTPPVMKLHSTVTGYADKQLRPKFGDGVTLERPFILLTGPNGSGKSAVLRAIRSTIGLSGERFGSASELLGARGTRHAPKKTKQDSSSFYRATDKPSAVLDLKALGWTGQTCYLFDSRAASQMATKSMFDDDDILYHVGLIAGGGSKVSHGEFVTRTWNEAIEWACGAPIESHNASDWSKERRKVAEKISGGTLSQERWLILDEPEGAIDIERMIIGLAAVLHVAEPGTLRVFCSSHSLLFAAGLADHPKIQTIDLGSQQGTEWMTIQKRAMQFATDHDWLEKVGADVCKGISRR